MAFTNEKSDDNGVGRTGSLVMADTVGRLNNAVLWAYKRKFADKASVAEG